MANASLWLYRVLYRLLLPVAVPALWLRDRLGGKSRPPLRSRWTPALPTLDRGGIWIQAVSVGEVELARRLLAEIRSQRPELPVLITATTATGLALAARTVTDDAAVCACPLDLVGSVSRVFDHMGPGLLVLVETELWPELLHQAAQRQVPVAVVNGRLSEASSIRYRRVGGLVRPLLQPLSLVLVREASDARRFALLGVPEAKIQVTGNVKYDIIPDPEPLSFVDRVHRLAAGRPVVVAGSTMDGEETQMLDAVAAVSNRGPVPFLILAPRHPERFDAVADILKGRSIDFVRRSSRSEDEETADVFLLDTIGELARTYQLASVAFVGGSLVPTGGHNPLEPAVWGIPVLSGDQVFNFSEVYDEMVGAGAARIVADGDELVAALARWLSEPDVARSAGGAGLEVVEANRGATARTVDALLALLDTDGTKG